MPQKTTKHPGSETSPPNEAGTVSANSLFEPKIGINYKKHWRNIGEMDKKWIT